jgi:hypothetical protein
MLSKIDQNKGDQSIDSSVSICGCMTTSFIFIAAKETFYHKFHLNFQLMGKFHKSTPVNLFLYLSFSITTMLEITFLN